MSDLSQKNLKDYTAAHRRNSALYAFTELKGIIDMENDDYEDIDNTDISHSDLYGTKTHTDRNSTGVDLNTSSTSSSFVYQPTTEPVYVEPINTVIKQTTTPPKQTQQQELQWWVRRVFGPRLQ